MDEAITCADYYLTAVKHLGEVASAWPRLSADGRSSVRLSLDDAWGARSTALEYESALHAHALLLVADAQLLMHGGLISQLGRAHFLPVAIQNLSQEVHYASADEPSLAADDDVELALAA